MPTLSIAAKAFFAVTDAFRISRIEDAARSIAPSDYYDGMALSRASDTIGAARRGMAVAALTGLRKAADPVAAWLEAGGERIGRIARSAAGADRRRRHHRVAAVGGIGADQRPDRL